MDVLPLYIVLLIGVSAGALAAAACADARACASVALYTLSWNLDWNLPAYPTGTWFFNPLTWQLIFVFGAWCALGGADTAWPVHALALWCSASRSPILLFAFLIVMTWYFPRYAVYIPKWLQDWMYPIDKTNMDVLRFAAFHRARGRDGALHSDRLAGLKSRWLKPMIMCGQHSLEIFCLGIFLSFLGHFVTSEVSRSVGMQILISVLGILVMIAVAWLITWYNTIEGRGSGAQPKPSDADLAGGEA